MKKTSKRSKTARVAVLVSGGGTNLQAILDAQNAGILVSGRVTLVVSDRENAYALERAKAAGVATAYIPRAMKTSQEIFDESLLSLLAEHKIDLVVLAGFLSILSPAVIRAYEDRIVNVHPSLIPSFCGMGFYGLKVHEAALARGVKVTGATVHLVNEIPDGGRILLQKAVRIYPNDTPERLQQRVMRQAEWKLLPRAVEMLSKEIIARS